jgi:gas vesicle protein
MGQDPNAIREEIEQTRAEMGETVDAIGYKADVPSRAKEKVGEKVDNVKAKVGETVTRAKETVTGAASRAGGTVSDTTPSGGEVKQSARRAVGLAQENPLGLAIGAAALGFLAGLAMPSSRVEDERLGPMADQIKDKAKETGQEALERGKQVAQEATQSAVQTTKERGQEHGQDLAHRAKQNAQEAGSQARSRTRTRS